MQQVRRPTFGTSLMMDRNLPGLRYCINSVALELDEDQKIRVPVVAGRFLVAYSQKYGGKGFMPLDRKRHPGGYRMLARSTRRAQAL